MNSVPVKTLDNGLRVATIELPHLHAACVSAYVRAGARFEASEDSGLSHFMEHMLHRGTKRHPDPDSFHAAVESIGGSLDAETRRDLTIYPLFLPPASVEAGMRLLGDMLIEPIFSSLEIERGVVLEEMNEDLDVRGRAIDLNDVVCRAMWPDHPLGQHIAGTRRNVRRFGLADLQRHHVRHYSARNMVLVVAGPLAHGQVVTWATETWARMPPGQRHETAAPVPALGPLRVHCPGDDEVQTQLSVSFSTFGVTDPDHPALLVLMRVLDDGLSTRLYRRIVHKHGLCYDVGADLDASADYGALDISAVAAHIKAPRVLSEILDLVTELRASPVPEAELERAKRRHSWEVRAMLDAPGPIADRWGEALLYDVAPSVSELEKQIAAITAADVQRVAARVFQPARMIVGTLGRTSRTVKNAIDGLIDAR